VLSIQIRTTLIRPVVLLLTRSVSARRCLSHNQVWKDSNLVLDGLNFHVVDVLNSYDTGSMLPARPAEGSAKVSRKV